MLLAKALSFNSEPDNLLRPMADEQLMESSRPRYRKPPVVEVAADFRLSPENLDKWDWNSVARFLKANIPDTDGIEVLRSMALTRKPLQRGEELELEYSEKPLRMRRYSAQRTYCVQISPDRLIINCLKTQQQIPHFEILKPLIETYFGSFVAQFNPAQIESVALSYVDDVTLPEMSQTNLADYFNIKVDFPKVFGSLQSIAVRGEWSDGPVSITLDLRDLKPYTFRLDWQAAKLLGGPAAIDTALAELEVCRRSLRERFHATFTDAGHQLFDPE